MTERHYHERYLGLDDRGCFEAALADAGQTVDPRLDDLIARKAGPLLRGRRGRASLLPRRRRVPGDAWPVAGPWRSTRGRSGRRSSSPSG